MSENSLGEEQRYKSKEQAEEALALYLLRQAAEAS